MLSWFLTQVNICPSKLIILFCIYLALKRSQQQELCSIVDMISIKNLADLVLVFDRKFNCITVWKDLVNKILLPSFTQLYNITVKFEITFDSVIILRRSAL